jgi:hypothetical protein
MAVRTTTTAKAGTTTVTAPQEVLKGDLDGDGVLSEAEEDALDRALALELMTGDQSTGPSATLIDRRTGKLLTQGTDGLFRDPDGKVVTQVAYAQESPEARQDRLNAERKAELEFREGQDKLDRDAVAAEGELSRAENAENDLALQAAGAASSAEAAQLRDQHITSERIALQNFNARQASSDNKFAAFQSALNRSFSAGESFLDRALAAGQFSSTFGASERDSQLAFERSRANDALAAAAQFSSQISDVDPNAVEAFLAVGGGNIANAIASGADALSDRSLIGAARSLRAIEAPRTGFQRVATPQFNVGSAPVTPTFEGATEGLPAPAVTPEFTRLDAGDPLRPLTSQVTAADVGGGVVTDAGTFTNFGSPTGALSEMSEAQLRSLPEFVRKDLSDEFKKNVPVVAAAHGMNETVTGPTLILAGENGPENVNIDPVGGVATSVDQPFIDRVRDFRRSSAISDFEPSNVNFRNLSNRRQQRFFRQRQTHYGIPVEDQAFEENRFRLAGIGRQFIRQAV